ncbi:helix-turn-helix domain-containing protein [Aerococcaceae bacterium NML160702]|nr:helix-turn-helix domain-containing protein [Aerococcaceae bacterium NML190073]MCW6681509.1 helix-turn-helix domain-containing protein [Aerococcaceae bacterium NML160702]
MKIATTAQRLKLLLSERSLKQVDILNLSLPFQKQLGIKMSKSALSQYVNGVQSPDQDRIYLLAKTLNVNEAWLMGFDVSKERVDDEERTEEVNNIINVYTLLTKERQSRVYHFAEEQLAEQVEANKKIISINEVRELYAQYQTDEENVDVYGVVSAGTGVELFDEIIEVVSCPSPVPEHDIALKVFGDSMYPLFQNEQIIFVNRTTEVRHGQIGVFVVNGQAFLKKLYKDYSSVKLISLNKDYDDIELTEFDRVDVIGTVVL